MSANWQNMGLIYPFYAIPFLYFGIIQNSNAIYLAFEPGGNA